MASSFFVCLCQVESELLRRWGATLLGNDNICSFSLGMLVLPVQVRRLRGFGWCPKCELDVVFLVLVVPPMMLWSPWSRSSGSLGGKGWQRWHVPCDVKVVCRFFSFSTSMFAFGFCRRSLVRVVWCSVCCVVCTGRGWGAWRVYLPRGYFFFFCNPSSFLLLLNWNIICSSLPV